MPIMFIALVVLGFVIYILSLVLAFSEESSAFLRKRQEAQMRLSQAESQCDEQQTFVDQLDTKIEIQRGRNEKQNQWIAKLKGQLAQLELIQIQKAAVEKARKKVIHLAGHDAAF